MLAGVAEGRGHSFDGLRRRDQCFRSVPLANTFQEKLGADHTVLIEKDRCRSSLDRLRSIFGSGLRIPVVRRGPSMIQLKDARRHQTGRVAAVSRCNERVPGIRPTSCRSDLTPKVEGSPAIPGADSAVASAGWAAGSAEWVVCCKPQSVLADP